MKAVPTGDERWSRGDRHKSRTGSPSQDQSDLLRIGVQLRLGVCDLDLRLVSEARSLAVVGPSGSGKSTLLRIIAGVEHRARGKVCFGGQVWLDTDCGVRVPPWSRPIGWVPQDGLLFPHKSVLGNLQFGADHTGKDDDVHYVAGLLQIDHLLARMPSRLSGGERQRVALGRALLAKPSLLLLDEPFSALDRPLRSEIRRVVIDWSEKGATTTVLVSHDEDDAQGLAEETFALADGTLKRYGG